MTETTLNVHPHDGQRAVHQHPARFKVLAAGRRWGKTRLGVNECIDIASRGGRAWWVAPSYKMGRVGWRPLARIGHRIGAEVRRGDQQILFRNGGEVSVRSADDPQSLRGEGLDYVVLDEGAFMREAAWSEALRPSLSDRQGGALFITTPKGRNWIWQLWMLGQSDDKEWMSWQCPTSDNPHIEPAEIEAARQSLPDRIFRQEYLAEFIDDAGGVFRNVMACATATEQAPYDGQFVYGVDWGKHNDFTAISVLDMTTRQMVAMDRFNQIDYSVQVGRLKALADRYKPAAIIAERNSMGEPLIEMLQRDNLPVRAFTTTNASKAQIIDGLALAFERGDIGIMNDPVLVGELQAYEMERLPSGLLRYNAPAGMHDDTVMSLALAWHGCANTVGEQVFWL